MLIKTKLIILFLGLIKLADNFYINRNAYPLQLKNEYENENKQECGEICDNEWKLIFDFLEQLEKIQQQTNYRRNIQENPIVFEVKDQNENFHIDTQQNNCKRNDIKEKINNSNAVVKRKNKKCRDVSNSQQNFEYYENEKDIIDSNYPVNIRTDESNNQFTGTDKIYSDISFIKNQNNDSIVNGSSSLASDNYNENNYNDPEHIAEDDYEVNDRNNSSEINFEITESPISEETYNSSKADEISNNKDQKIDINEENTKTNNLKLNKTGTTSSDNYENYQNTLETFNAQTSLDNAENITSDENTFNNNTDNSDMINGDNLSFEGIDIPSKISEQIKSFNDSDTDLLKNIEKNISNTKETSSSRSFESKYNVKEFQGNFNETEIVKTEDSKVTNVNKTIEISNQEVDQISKEFPYSNEKKESTFKNSTNSIRLFSNTIDNKTVISQEEPLESLNNTEKENGFKLNQIKLTNNSAGEDLDKSSEDPLLTSINENNKTALSQEEIEEIEYYKDEFVNSTQQIETDAYENIDNSSSSADNANYENENNTEIEIDVTEKPTIFLDLVKDIKKNQESLDQIQQEDNKTKKQFNQTYIENQLSNNLKSNIDQLEDVRNIKEHENENKNINEESDPNPNLNEESDPNSNHNLNQESKEQSEVKISHKLKDNLQNIEKDENENKNINEESDPNPNLNEESDPNSNHNLNQESKEQSEVKISHELKDNLQNIEKDENENKNINEESDPNPNLNEDSDPNPNSNEESDEQYEVKISHELKDNLQNIEIEKEDQLNKVKDDGSVITNKKQNIMNNSTNLNDDEINKNGNNEEKNYNKLKNDEIIDNLNEKNFENVNEDIKAVTNENEKSSMEIINEEEELKNFKRGSLSTYTTNAIDKKKEKNARIFPSHIMKIPPKY